MARPGCRPERRSCRPSRRRRGAGKRAFLLLAACPVPHHTSAPLPTSPHTAEPWSDPSCTSCGAAAPPAAAPSTLGSSPLPAAAAPPEAGSPSLNVWVLSGLLIALVAVVAWGAYRTARCRGWCGSGGGGGGESGSGSRTAAGGEGAGEGRGTAAGSACRCRWTAPSPLGCYQAAAHLCACSSCRAHPSPNHLPTADPNAAKGAAAPAQPPARLVPVIAVMPDLQLQCAIRLAEPAGLPAAAAGASCGEAADGPLTASRPTGSDTAS